MHADQRAAYLDRLAVAEPAAPTADALIDLHVAHLHRIPFENLSIHLDEPIELDPPRLVDKLTDRRRGGFCYELNGAFATLLESLGFEVELRAAGVFVEPGRLSAPLDHLALVVRCPADAAGAAWLADVGFGDSPLRPIRLDSQEPVPDPMGAVDVVPSGDGAIDLRRAGEPRYRMEPRARRLRDFVPTCWWHRTSPDSPFTRDTICTRRTDAGRVTLSGRRLIVTEDGDRAEHVLERDDALLAAYRDWFDIHLDRVPPV